MYTHAHMHTHTHMHMHAHIHTHTHIAVHSPVFTSHMLIFSTNTTPGDSMPSNLLSFNLPRRMKRQIPGGRWMAS